LFSIILCDWEGTSSLFHSLRAAAWSSGYLIPNRGWRIRRGILIWRWRAGDTRRVARSFVLDLSILLYLIWNQSCSQPLIYSPHLYLFSHWRRSCASQNSLSEQCCKRVFVVGSFHHHRLSYFTLKKTLYF
jgi:hypothetical protein